MDSLKKELESDATKLLSGCTATWFSMPPLVSKLRTICHHMKLSRFLSRLTTHETEANDLRQNKPKYFHGVGRYLSWPCHDWQIGTIVSFLVPLFCLLFAMVARGVRRYSPVYPHELLRLLTSNLFFLRFDISTIMTMDFNISERLTDF